MFTSECVATTDEVLMSPVKVMSWIDATMIEEVADEIAADLMRQDYSSIDLKIGRRLIHVRAKKMGVKIEMICDLPGTLLDSTAINRGVRNKFRGDTQCGAIEILLSNINAMLKANAKKQILPMTTATMRNIFANVNRAMAELYPECHETNEAIA